MSKRSFVNLAQKRLGAEVVSCSDDFFAAKERLIDPADPVFIPDKYDEHGKWMDGWESRRRRDGGYDYCVIRLGQPGIIDALEIDTSHFTGNYPPEASVEAALSSSPTPDSWTEVLSRLDLQGDSKKFVELDSTGPWTHLRLNIFPDGGVARLRVYGCCHMDWQVHDNTESLDLIAIQNGGVAVACNDEHFGKLSNVLLPGSSLNMGDGWETRRRREPGHDWGIIKLGHPGIVEQIIIETDFFKGNYPDRCSIQWTDSQHLSHKDLEKESAAWRFLLPEQAMQADQKHVFVRELLEHDAVSHIRLNLIPDGGVSRLRLFGKRVDGNGTK